MRTRVLLLNTDLNIGGAPHFVRDLACGLDKSEFDVQVASLAPEGPVAKEIQAASIPVHCMGAKGILDVRIFYHLARIISTFRPHILHASLVHSNIVARLLGCICNLPHVVATIHTAEQGKQWHLILENLTCRMSDVTVCVSPSVLQHVLHYSHVPETRLKVIKNGIDWERFKNAKPLDCHKEGINTEKITLMFVGRLDPVKNIDLLLMATSHLQKDHNIQLLILGDGPERNKLESLKRKLNLDNTVYFIGPRRDVERWLKIADIFILPSKWEGFGLAALEAMAAGVPVIATDVTGLNDIIMDGQTGLLVPSDNDQQLSKVIDNLIKNPD
ncbi:MAG: glycosyltransferase, partial [Sedimentisphaerales bacterium]|nr:glycosyltransferase [Sedimentisphaerales bacterium]